VVNISSCLNAKTSATLKQMAFLALNKSSYGRGLKNPAGPCWGGGVCGGRSREISLHTGKMLIVQNKEVSDGR
jgi:hypothetical protein